MDGGKGPNGNAIFLVDDLILTLVVELVGFYVVAALIDQACQALTDVEPAEVESALRMQPDIDDAVVVAAFEPPVLVAHVESRGFDEGVVRARLSERLPKGSIPRRFVRHDQLPRNTNGKIDRTAASRLPVARLDSKAPSADPRRRRATIDVVLDAWRAALERTDVDDDTDFFEVGGDSLSAVEVVSAIAEALDRKVPIAALLTGR